MGKGSDRLEITTFRADSYDQVSRNPQVRFGDSLNDDLVRRDFTANAMAVQITAEGPGSSSTRSADSTRSAVGCSTPRPHRRCPSGTIRCACCGQPASCPSWSSGWPDRVQEAIVEMAPQLERITVERVAVELDKMLLGADPMAGLELMVRTGMGEVVLPEIGGMQMAIDEHHQHKDVYHHSLTVLRRGD